jgi:single-strand DNA-binding protein
MYQKITLIGNLGSDPEMRYLESGSPVTNFSLATNRKYTKDDKMQKETIWFRISVWGRTAENCNTFLKKGRKVMVEGRLVADKETGRPRVYERNDGTFDASFEVSAERVFFLDGKTEEKDAEESQYVEEEVADNEFPF